MSYELHRKPKGESGKVHDITPENAGWTYVGFGLYDLKPGETAAEATGTREVILVMLEGYANISGAGQQFGKIGSRESIFDPIAPQSVYIPNDSEWSLVAVTNCKIAVCSAPGRGGHKAQVLEAPERVTKGKGGNTRHIFPIAMEDYDVADSLLVTECVTPSGHWSSYPPHRHDSDDFPTITHLEESYYHRLNPAQGYAHQRVYNDSGTLDETFTVHDGEVVLVPEGYHPCGAPYGYDLYYLNVMAGPLRKWRFENHPAHDWIAQRDA